jgi:hypothetical protein
MEHEHAKHARTGELSISCSLFAHITWLLWFVGTATTVLSMCCGSWWGTGQQQRLFKMGSRYKGCC